MVVVLELAHVGRHVGRQQRAQSSMGDWVSRPEETILPPLRASAASLPLPHSSTLTPISANRDSG